jgi:hypothetical protein
MPTGRAGSRIDAGLTMTCHYLGDFDAVEQARQGAR